MANPPPDIPSIIAATTAAITALIGAVTSLVVGVARLLAEIRRWRQRQEVPEISHSIG
jgi:hypothetical protein